MIFSRYWVAAAVAGSVIVAPLPAGAQVDPFAAASSIVSWFERLNRDWDRVVTNEERQQLVRQLDRMRRQLYFIASDSELLLNSLPDLSPDSVERAQLEDQVDDLQMAVSALRSIATELIVELGASDAEAATLVGRAVAARSAALLSTESSLRRSVSAPAAWEPAGLRLQMRVGIIAISRAQIAVTRFRNRLAAHR